MCFRGPTYYDENGIEHTFTVPRVNFTRGNVENRDFGQRFTNIGRFIIRTRQMIIEQFVDFESERKSPGGTGKFINDTLSLADHKRIAARGR